MQQHQPPKTQIYPGRVRHATPMRGQDPLGRRDLSDKVHLLLDASEWESLALNPLPNLLSGHVLP